MTPAVGLWVANRTPSIPTVISRAGMATTIVISRTGLTVSVDTARPVAIGVTGIAVFIIREWIAFLASAVLGNAHRRGPCAIRIVASLRLRTAGWHGRIGIVGTGQALTGVFVAIAAIEPVACRVVLATDTGDSAILLVAQRLRRIEVATGLCLRIAGRAFAIKAEGGCGIITAIGRTG